MENQDAASKATAAEHIENARAMADNLLKCPSSEQHIGDILGITAQAIRNLCDVVEELDARVADATPQQSDNRAADQVDRCVEDVIEWCKRAMPHFQQGPEFEVAKALDDELHAIVLRHLDQAGRTATQREIASDARIVDGRS